jgi:two-component system response regulator FixJ
MKDYAGQHIFFVDDEPQVRKVVGKTLQQLGSKVSCFASAADCLKRLHSKTCDLLITDVKMPTMDGIELLLEAKRIAPWLPVLVITGYGDIPMAVRAVQAGAWDFIEKPLDRQDFLAAVEAVLKQNGVSEPLLGKSLTKTQLRILSLVLDGKSNREMASLLHRSTRTIEFHRTRIMRKLGVKNVVGLVKRATMMGLGRSSIDQQ